MQWLINSIIDAVMNRFTGMILIYSGPADEVPAGWQYCDGTNGTPDLRERFVCCEGGYLPHGTQGGWPIHNHAEKTASLETTHLPYGPNVQGGPGWNKESTAHTHEITFQDANHLPPFYCLAYIMKTP